MIEPIASSNAIETVSKGSTVAIYQKEQFSKEIVSLISKLKQEDFIR